MADLLPTDVLLVNRAGVDHSIVQSDVMADVLDTDLLLVNRAGVDYNASYADVKKGFGPEKINPAPSDWTFAPAIAGGTGTQADPFIITPETVSVPGGTVQSAQTLTLTGLHPNDLVEWTNHSTGTGDRFHQDLALVPTGGQVDLRLKYLDTPNSTVGAAYTGDLQIGTSYVRWVVTPQVKVAPVIGAVTLADSPEAGRFTSGTCASAVTMTEDGLPVSTKGLKAWVEGTLKSAAQTSGIANVAGNVLTLTDSTQLANFAAGDAVTEVGGGGDATGTVGSVDVTAKTITLSASTGTWDVGSKVKGPLKTQIVTITPKTSAITNVAGNVLTLTDNTDLANFSVGDVVQLSGAGNTAWNETQVWSSGITGTSGGSPVTVSNPPNTFDGSTSTRADVTHTGGKDSVLTWTPPAGSMSGTTFRIWCYQPQGSSGANEYLSVNGGAYVIDTGNWAAATPNANGWSSLQTIPGGTLTSIALKLVYGGMSRQGLFAIEVDGKILVDPSAVKVTAIDKAAPSITTDGGSWSGTDATSSGTLADREAFVTGPTLPAASGKVSSVNAAATPPTMIVSPSTGRWLETHAGYEAGKKLNTFVEGPPKPASNVRLYTIHDSAGLVSDLQSADPGYVTMAGNTPYTLTFPAVLPSGSAPDVDLPAGTTLTTEIQATSAGSTAVTKASNIVTPT